MRLLTLAVLMSIAGCEALPRDAGDTSRRVAATRQMVVGLTTTSQASKQGRAFISQLAGATGARPDYRVGETEPLLVQLEAGRLDVTLAWFDEKTPWGDRVALTPPLTARGRRGHRLELRAAARNGESRWAMLLEKTSRAVSPEAQQ